MYVIRYSYFHVFNVVTIVAFTFLHTHVVITHMTHVVITHMTHVVITVEIVSSYYILVMLMPYDVTAIMQPPYWKFIIIHISDFIRLIIELKNIS